MKSVPRRQMMTGSSAILAQCAMGGAAWAAADAPPHAQRITLAQVEVSRTVSDNLDRFRAAFDQARRDSAGWVLFPEMALSGHYDQFDQAQIGRAFDQVRAWCRQSRAIGLIGTGWKQEGKTFNQIRIVDREGRVRVRA
jgi:predicted amidohydrolase